MFVTGGLPILPVVLLLLLVGVLNVPRELSWPGRSPGDNRSEGLLNEDGQTT